MNFNALNGFEARDYILSKVREAMEGSGEFPANLTFPWFRFEFSLKISRLTGRVEEPVVEREQRPLVVAETVGETPALDSPEVETLELVGGMEVSVPDEARVESGQPIHVEVESETGQKVDRPKAVRPRKPSPWLVGEDS